MTQQVLVNCLNGLVECPLPQLEGNEARRNAPWLQPHFFFLFLLCSFLLVRIGVQLIFFVFFWWSFSHGCNIFASHFKPIPPEGFGVRLWIMVVEEGGGKGLKILLELYLRVLLGVVVEFVCDGFVLLEEYLLEDGGRVGFYLFHGDMGEGLVFVEVGEGLLHGFSPVDLVDVFDVLRAYLVDDVGAVGFIPVVMSLLMEEPNLTRLTKLSKHTVTSLRLLFKFQLSNPRLERGSLARPSFR